MLPTALLVVLSQAPEPTLELPRASERAPAVAKTDVTVFNARGGATSELTRARYQLGDGYTVSTGDGRFSLQLRARVQVRYDLEHPNLPGQSTRHLLQIRRMRLLLQGAVFSPHVRYYFQFGFSPLDMSNDIPVDAGVRRNIPVRDARIELDRLRDLNVWVGQFKVPFSRQRKISSSSLNMVDRSLVNAEFNLDRDLGVQLSSTDLGGLGGRLAYFAGVFMGEGRNVFQLNDTGMLYAARLELLPFGRFDDYTEGDLARARRPGLSIAGAYAFHDRARAARGNIGDAPLDRGTTDFHHVNTDILFKWRGLAIATALHLRKGFNRLSGGAQDDTGAARPTVAARQGLACYAQVGQLVPRIPLEVVGRYGLIRNQYGAERSSLPEADELGAGLNWYFLDHDLKVQLDYFRLWDPSMGASPGERVRNGTDRLRIHVQLFF